MMTSMMRHPLMNPSDGPMHGGDELRKKGWMLHGWPSRDASPLFWTLEHSMLYRKILSPKQRLGQIRQVAEADLWIDSFGLHCHCPSPGSGHPAPPSVTTPGRGVWDACVSPIYPFGCFVPWVFQETPRESLTSIGWERKYDTPYNASK